jgi:RNA polymerase sigma-70 factor (ECF subfamily)
MRESTDFETFYRETHPRLWAYLTTGSGDRALAEEVAQEAFVRLLASRGAYLPDDQRRAYLFRIAENLLRDGSRRRRREAPLDGAIEAVLEARPGACGGVDGAVERAEGLDAGRALRVVSARQRRLLWLAYVEEHSHVEIARILSLAPGSVRVLLHRARRRFAAAYRTETNDDSS